MTPDLRAQLGRLARLCAGRPAAYADEVDQAYEQILGLVLDLGVQPVDDEGYQDPDYLKAQELGNAASEAAQRWRLSCLSGRADAELLAFNVWVSWFVLRTHVRTVTGDTCDAEPLGELEPPTEKPLREPLRLLWAALEDQRIEGCKELADFVSDVWDERVSVSRATGAYAKLKAKLIPGAPGDVIRNPGVYGRV